MENIIGILIALICAYGLGYYRCYLAAEAACQEMQKEIFRLNKMLSIVGRDRC